MLLSHRRKVVNAHGAEADHCPGAAFPGIDDVLLLIWNWITVSQK